MEPAQCILLLFFRFRTLGFAVSLVLSLVVQLGVIVFPGNQAVLAPCRRTEHAEILHIGGAPFVGEVDVQNGSANTEEHPVLVNGVDVVFYIFEVLFKAEGDNTVNVFVGCVGCIEADTAADLLQNKTVVAAHIFVLPLKTTEFNADCFSYLQNDSPFFMP